jgi:hypothetical protein
MFHDGELIDPKLRLARSDSSDERLPARWHQLSLGLIWSSIAIDLIRRAAKTPESRNADRDSVRRRRGKRDGEADHGERAEGSHDVSGSRMACVAHGWDPW